MSARWVTATLLAWLVVLQGSAWAAMPLGWPKDDLSLTEPEHADLLSTQPLFAKRLGRVSLESGQVCLPCGDFADNMDLGLDHVRKRVSDDYPKFLRGLLLRSSLFQDDIKDRLAVRATLLALDRNSSVGGRDEQRNKLTSGATLTARLSMRYDLLDKDEVVGTWEVVSSSTSNSLQASDRIAESFDGAIKRNARSFVLKVLADHSARDAERARRALAAIGGEADSTRTVLGYLVYGATKTVVAAAGVVGDGLTAVAQNGNAIGAGLQSQAASMDRMNRASNDAHAQALVDSRARPVAQRTPEAAPARASRASADPPTVNPASAVDDRRVAADAAAQRLQQRQQAEEDRLRASKERADRQAKEKEDRLAKEQADRQAEQREMDNYLAAMRQGIQLRATKCPDNAGHYYATGTMPKVKGDHCIDVTYEATCPGSLVSSRGVARNFIGMSGCFGDTYQIEPKPMCTAPEVSVRVTEVRPGCR